MRDRVTSVTSRGSARHLRDSQREAESLGDVRRPVERHGRAGGTILHDGVLESRSIDQLMTEEGGCRKMGVYPLPTCIRLCYRGFPGETDSTTGPERGRIGNMGIVGRIWSGIGHVSIVHWLWTLLPAGGLGAVVGVLSYLEDRPFSVIVLLTVLTIAATLWLTNEVRRQVRMVNEAEATVAPPSAYNDKHLRDEMARVIGTHQQIISDYQRMSGLESRIEEVRRDIEKLGDLNNQNLEYARRQIASLYDALAAVYHRERLKRFAAAIEAGGVELSSPIDLGTVYNEEQWKLWLTNERAWRKALEQWCHLASCYYSGIEEKVMTVSEAQYQEAGVAQAGQFPGEGLIAYKAFRARLQNFRNWHAEAKRAVHQVAFNGGTAGSRPIYPGGGELEEDRDKR